MVPFSHKDSSHRTKTVCFFGIYDPHYARNRVLMKGFERHGYDIIEVHADPATCRGIKKYFALYKEYRLLGTKTFDHVVVAFPGHTVVWLARILFGKDIIFDSFVSLYNSNVEDRRKYTPYSVRAVWDWLLDWSACHLAGKVLLDTNTHKEYFSKTFFVPQKKLIRVFVGTDDDLFFPQQNTTMGKKYMIHFHGKPTPLHGIEYIIDAAKILEQHDDIVFRLVGCRGRGDVVARMSERGVRNVELVDSVPYEALPDMIRTADVCLGVFGNSKKVDMVIPNKVYEAVACGVPVITARTKAITELFSDQESIILCEKSNPRDLAEKILLLKNNAELRARVARGGYQVWSDYARPHSVVGGLLEKI